MLVLLTISCLLATAFSAITLTLDQGTQDYYFRFAITADSTSCSISSVAILVNNQWVDSDNIYGNAYDWNYNGVRFGDMEPISVKITTSNGNAVELPGAITSNTKGAVYVISKSLCDGTPVAAPTPQPIAPTKPTTAYPTAESVCMDTDDMEWRSYNNQIYLNGNRFNMKGLSWFGFETGNYGLYGLDKHNIDWYLTWIKDNGFNAIRLPFSGDYLRASDSNKETYRAFIEAAGKKGILIMPDYHSDNAGSWTDGLNTINKANSISLWKTMANKLKGEWNVFAADIFNEPHDVTDSQWGDWISFCEDAADAIWSTGVNWLAAVEGTNWQCDRINCAWGENLEGVRESSRTFSNTKYGSNRFIWSPHVYGADVTGNPYSTDGWTAHWGYLVNGVDDEYDNSLSKKNEAASVIGEFGTTYVGGMVNWLNDLVDYLISIDQRNTFFWCLNPNSGDTGGLLQDDWTTPQTGKLEQLARLQPNPSVLTYNSNTGKVCISGLGDTAPEPDPVPSPTPAPTSAGSSGGSGSTIVVSTEKGSNMWWFAVELNSGKTTAQWVKMRDSSMSGWETCVYDSTNKFYYCTGNKPYASGDIDIKIRINGVTTTKQNCLGSYSPGYSCTMSAGSSYSEADAVSDTTLNWTEWFGIIVGILIGIACIIGLVICIKRRKKGDVSFNENTTINGIDTPQTDGDIDGNDTKKKGYDMSRINTDDVDKNDKDVIQDEQEIEVEMNITNNDNDNY